MLKRYVHYYECLTCLATRARGSAWSRPETSTIPCYGFTETKECGGTLKYSHTIDREVDKAGRDVNGGAW